MQAVAGVRQPLCGDRHPFVQFVALECRAATGLRYATGGSVPMEYEQTTFAPHQLVQTKDFYVNGANIPPPIEPAGWFGALAICPARCPL